MKIAGRAIVAVFVLAVVVLYVVIYVVPDLRGALRKTAVLEYGNLAIYDDVTAYVVRDETVYKAARTGEIRYYVGEGVKVRKGVKLLDIIAGSGPVTAAEAGDSETEDAAAAERTALRSRIGDNGVALEQNAAQESGVVSYFIDGYESLFSFENLPSLTRESVSGVSGSVVNVTRHDGRIARGEPIYKLSDNTQWYMVFWFDKTSGAVVNYISGETVAVRMQGGEVGGRIDGVVDQGDAWRVVLSFDKYYENLAQLRRADATVVVSDYKGLLVDNESIVSREDTVGVYAKQKSGDFKFVPVNVVRSDGVRSIISMTSFTDAEDKQVRTVNIYEEILCDPEQFEQ
jgi:putative membrane fusion protein